MVPIKAPKTVDLKKFDYTTKRSIYSVCQEMYCPNLETSFIGEFLKRNYSVIFVTINQPYRKLKPRFKAFPSQHFFVIDTVSKISGEEKENNVLYLEPKPSLTQLAMVIESVWKKLPTKQKLLFFDCSEFLLVNYGQEMVFDFLRQVTHRLEKEGIVVFCWLKGTQDMALESMIVHLFDEVISL